MKLYSFLGRLYFLIFIYISSTSWALPYEKRSSHVEFTNYNRRKLSHGKILLKGDNKLKYVLYNIKDIHVQLSSDVIYKNKKLSDVHQEVKYATTPKYSGNVGEYKNRHGDEVSLAEALTQKSEEKSSINMVLPIAGTITVLFSMGLLVAIFQCCCRKRQSSDTEEVKSSDNKPADSGKTSGNDVGKEDKPQDHTQGPENEEPFSIRSKIKAFEGVIPTKPSPGPLRPTKKRPESNAFKALENQGIVYGMGKSPSRLSKTPEDENQNQNAILTQEIPKSEGEATPDDDLGGYKQPQNPDVVIAEVDEDDEFSAIKRDTSVLRSYKKAPPPKNRNRSSAAVRRKRARETTTDVLFNDSSDNSFLNVPDDLEVMYTDNKSEGNNSTERNKNKDHNKSDTNEKNKNKTDKSDSMEKKKNKSDKIDSSERNKNKKDKNQKDKKEVDKNETPNIVTSDYSDDNIIDISKQEVPPEVFTGGNIFMHIDPTVKKKNGAKIEKKPATPPTTRIRSSQLSVEERKEKAKSTPLSLSSHEDLAKALGKLKSPSKENNTQKIAGKNRSSTDLSSNSHL